MFHRPRKSPLAGQNKALKDLSRIISTEQILSDDKRQSLLHKMKKFSGLEAARYESLCSALIDQCVNYCQSLPEANNNYYAHPVGLVDFALNRTEAALSLFQEFMIQDQPGLLSEEQKLWQYALYSAAMLQGIGKLYVDYRINLYDAEGHRLQLWNPLLDNLTATGTYYDYEFQKETDEAFRCRLNLLLATAIVPASGFAWIASDPQVLAVWLALLNEDYRSAGTLGAILIRAEAMALQRYFVDSWGKGAAHRANPYGRVGTFSGGPAETLIETEQAVVADFIKWLTTSLEQGRIMINKSPLFSVPGGLLMCQEMFQLFVRENPQYKNWQAVQNAFLAQGLHRVGADGSAISRFEQVDNRQMQSGIVFADYAVALPASLQYLNLKTGKVVSLSALEFIHRAQNNSYFTQQHESTATSFLGQLAANGQWQPIKAEITPNSPGVTRGG